MHLIQKVQILQQLLCTYQYTKIKQSRENFTPTPGASGSVCSSTRFFAGKIPVFFFRPRFFFRKTGKNPEKNPKKPGKTVSYPVFFLENRDLPGKKNRVVEHTDLDLYI